MVSANWLSLTVIIYKAKDSFGNLHISLEVEAIISSYELVGAWERHTKKYGKLSRLYINSQITSKTLED